MKRHSSFKYPRSFNSVWGLILGLLTAFVLYNVFDYMFNKSVREGMEHANGEPKPKRNRMSMAEDTEVVNPLVDDPTPSSS